MRFFTLFTLLLMASGSPVYAADDALISTSWSPMNVGQIQCLKVAEGVLWFNKFKNSDYGEGSAWGSKGDYKALIGCVDDKNMAFFVVVGPNGKQTRDFVDKISYDFRKELGIKDDDK